MRRSLGVLAAGLGLPFLACADGSGWTGTVRDSAGVAVVENPRTGIWADDDAPTVERELEIGAADGPAELQFADIRAIDVSGSGDIYVLDAQARSVRVFDALGTFLHEMGGSGSGPGELSQAVDAVFVTAGDSVLVADMSQRRLVRYSPEGQPIGTVTVPIEEGVLVQWAATPGGRIIQQSRLLQDRGTAGAPPTRDVLIERAPDGTVVDTILELPAGSSLMLEGDRVRVRIFSAEPEWAIGSDGRIYFAVSNDYTLFIHTPDGRLERVVRRPFEPRPVSESDRQALLDAIAALYRRQGAPPAAVPRMMENLEFASFYPAFDAIVGGPEGTIWVRRSRTAGEILAADGAIDIQDTGSSTFDVFDRDGRYLGMLELPPRFTPMRVIDDLVYGVWRDELDVQHVQRLRVRGTWTAD